MLIFKAHFDQQTITVYQAFNNAIANDALINQKFLPPHFSLSRMTWIKTSFLWMMYRSNWASNVNQERVLRIRISLNSFFYFIEKGCLSHFHPHIYTSEAEWKTKLSNSDIRIQFDPERDLFLNKNKDLRAIQIGLSSLALENYNNKWIISIEDCTNLAKKIHNLVQNKEFEQALNMLPKETIFHDVTPYLANSK